MFTRRAQSLLAAVCLIWFGLTNTLLAGGIVVCRDGHGGTRIEWGCSRNTDGECATTCGTDSADHEEAPAHPCDDTPVTADHHTTKAPPRVSADLTPVAILLAAPAMESLPHARRPGPVITERDHPPDSLYRLRTVIILV